MRPLKSLDFKRMAAVSSLALILPSSIAVGLVFGYFLDRWLKTEPWMLLTWTVLGIISGIMNLFRGIKRYLDENQGEDNRQDNAPHSKINDKDNISRRPE